MIATQQHQFTRVEGGWPACACGYEPVGVPKLEANDLVTTHVHTVNSPTTPMTPLQRWQAAVIAAQVATAELQAAAANLLVDGGSR